MSRAVIAGRQSDCPSPMLGASWGLAIKSMRVVWSLQGVAPDQVVIVGRVVVAPYEMLSFGRVDVVSPDQVFVGRPVRDVAEQNPFGLKEADRVVETNQV